MRRSDQKKIKQLKMANVETAIRDYLIQIENRPTIALKNITEILSRSEQPLDDQIKTRIATRANTWINETIRWVDIENSLIQKSKSMISENKITTSNVPM